MTGQVRVVVTGSRKLKDRGLVYHALDETFRRYGPFIVVHGACQDRGGNLLQGADRFADEWARANAHKGVVAEWHPADWERYGKRAGPIRNQEMVDLHPVEVLAFPLGESPGTRGCMRMAQAAGIHVREYPGR